jgi:ABC-type amino acid transport substrate-binding protein
MVKRLVSSLVAALFLCVAIHGASAASSQLAQIQSSKTIKFGWAAWTPYEYRDMNSGQLKGMLIDLANALAAQLNVKPEFVEDNWSTITQGIASGKYNVAIEGVTMPRQKIVDFSRPLYQTDYTALVLASSKYQTWDDLNKPGTVIAVPTGANVDDQLTAMQAAGTFKGQLVRLKDVGAAVLEMTSGRAAAYAGQRDHLLSVVAQHPEYRITKGNYGAEYFSVAIPKGDTELKAAIDQAVVGVIKNGTMQKLLADYHAQGTQVGSTQ